VRVRLRWNESRSWRRSLYTLIFLCAGTWSLQGQVAKDADPQGKPADDGMRFEVAAIRPDKGEFRPPSFALSSDDWFRDPKGRFHADFAVVTYIEFAYKLWLTRDQRRVMLAGAPGWVSSDRYAIEATAPLNATKDQYRAMMKALLEERFGLKIHFEEKEMPVLEMVLIKPGTPGPRLIPHEKGPACDAKPTSEVYPSECYSFSAMSKDGHVLFGSRGTPMELVGRSLANVGGGTGEVGRPVVDRTGLTGRWDYTLEVAMPFGGKAAPDAPAPEGPTLLEAIQEQLGVRLKAGKDVLSVPVVDHIELPSEN
jgi:uncharacterized protein (TIGR03435 family)